MYTLLFVISLIVFGYLMYVLIKPENFNQQDDENRNSRCYCANRSYGGFELSSGEIYCQGLQEGENMA